MNNQLNDIVARFESTVTNRLAALEKAVDASIAAHQHTIEAATPKPQVDKPRQAAPDGYAPRMRGKPRRRGPIGSILG